VRGHSGIDFIPDTILDLGGNVGCFSRYVRKLFPGATIIAVEPNPGNCEVFRQNTQGVTLIEAAIGKGDVYHLPGANGAMEVYLSIGLGYASFDLPKSGVKSMMLTDLKRYIKGKTLLKLDIEGSETVIFNDPESVELMKTFDYICIELHYFASDGATMEDVINKTDEVLNSLSETHYTRRDGVYFYARKR
jgi:FkbM family methyltransferase